MPSYSAIFSTLSVAFTAIRNMHTHRYGCISARFLARIHRSRMKLTLKFLMLVLLARKVLLRDSAHLLIFQIH